MNINDKDELFLKEFMNKLFDTIIYNLEKFKVNKIEYLIDSFKLINNKLKCYNNINDMIILIRNHQNHDSWFSSINGLFYQCENHRNTCLNYYLLAIKNEEILNMINFNINDDDDNDDDDNNNNNYKNFDDSIFQMKNVIIGKYLLALFYYEELIINKPISLKLNSNYEKIDNLTLQHLKDFNECRKNSLGNSYDNIYYFLLCVKYGLKNIDELNNVFNYYKNLVNKKNNLLAKLIVSICYTLRLSMDKEKKTFEWFLNWAEEGNSFAQNNLASYYQYGIGIDKDERKAFEWYLKSAKDGNNPIAQNNLAYCYQYGIGIDKDEKEAFKWYSKSSNAGNYDAQNNLAFCYKNGIGTNINEIKAFKLFITSAKAGNSNAQNNLASCYQYGIGIVKDEMKAFGWYLKSSESGNFDAQNNLGICYQYGIGTLINERKAVECFFSSAKGNNSFAQNNLAFCYQYGIGIEINEKKAIEWYSKSAKAGNSDAQINLDYCSK
ncbi:hypothetical protein RclHR1_01520025 [Rhizophagus clarus]|uniref:Sel1 repeat family protein n=1 Tax=Rhizophagus clarus TaxID=94130 RepID=A0A2Z6QEM5_9GLOM|nr:hypothetical protein RclHR1_01520025 [Rhizophagus clarus]GES78710.1 Sel1 repeat family protein [Rhizophagus clarus]